MSSTLGAMTLHAQGIRSNEVLRLYVNPFRTKAESTKTVISSHLRSTDVNATHTPSGQASVDLGLNSREQFS